MLWRGSQTESVGNEKDPRSITRGLTFSDPFGLCPPCGSLVDPSVVLNAAAAAKGAQLSQQIQQNLVNTLAIMALGTTVEFLSEGLGGSGTSSVESEEAPGTAVSTFRETTEGETFEHYGYSAEAGSFAGGMNSGSYATRTAGLSGAEARSSLALPRAAAPDAAYTVTPRPGTLVRVNPAVRPANGQAGGGSEIEFILGTQPGTVGPAKPVP
jgi:hypothetical protein